jgi:Right handed beta helix region
MSQTRSAIQSRRGARWASVLAVGVLLVTAFFAVGVASASPTHVLRVPSQYPTIQSALSAAHSGDTILVAPGIYAEAFVATISVNIVGSGIGSTVIQSPGNLGPNVATVSVIDHAALTLSGLTVLATNPGGAGVLVTDGSSALVFASKVVAGPNGEAIEVAGSSSATVTGNLIVATANPTDANEAGVFAFDSSWVTITHNVIMGPGGAGVYLDSSSAMISNNLISQFGCGYNASQLAAGLCGPNFATQFQGVGVADIGDAGLGTTISNNVIASTDVGVSLLSGCPGCVVKNNLIVGSADYGLAGTDGSYSFAQDLVIGGAYAVGSIAFSVNTVVTLSGVVMVGQSAPRPAYYYEDACLEVFGYTCTATIGGT